MAQVICRTYGVGVFQGVTFKEEKIGRSFVGVGHTDDEDALAYFRAHRAFEVVEPAAPAPPPLPPEDAPPVTPTPAPVAPPAGGSPEAEGQDGKQPGGTGGQEPSTPDVFELEAMTKAELIAYAEKHGVNLAGAELKADILERILG